MNKELEHLEILKDWANEHHNFKEVCGHSIPVEEALQRLEAIDNSKSSEALLGLEHIKKYYIPQPCSSTTYDYLETIKQALIKSQEQEKENVKLKGQVNYLTEIVTEFQKRLSTIREKNVDILDIRMSKTVDDYNFAINSSNLNRKDLTQEEFDLLKRCCNEQNN